MSINFETDILKKRKTALDIPRETAGGKMKKSGPGSRLFPAINLLIRLKNSGRQ